MERLCRYHQHLIMRILNKQHVLAKYLYGVSSRHKEIDFRSKKILSNAILKVHLLNLNRMIGASPVVNQSLCHSDAGRAQHATSAVNEFLHCGRSGSFNFAARLHRLQLALSRSFSTSSRNRSSGRPDGDEEENKEEKDKDEFELPTLILWLWRVSFIFSILWMVEHYMQKNKSPKFISWNEFYHDMLAKGEVEKVMVNTEMEMAAIHLHHGAVIKGNKVESLNYFVKIVDVDKFEEKVRQAESELGIKQEDCVSISYKRPSNWEPAIGILLLGFLVFISRKSFSKIKIPSPMDMFANERKAKFVRVDTLTQKGEGVSFKEVAGLKEAKIEIMEFVDYLKAPERFKELGARIPHGALLLGPPGCGKTLLAKAVATEARVPFLAMAGSEFVEMLGGLGAARVRDLFKEAKTRRPCIIYIDEIDAIGRKRSGSGVGSSGEEEQTLNQLLVEMDGMETTEDVIVLAATNRADILDKALLRPGRFDRHILIDFPTLIERLEIFDMYLLQLKTEELSKNYSSKLAQMTPGMTGADINNICNEAAIHAASNNKKIVSMEDLDYAIERVIAGVAKKSTLLSPEEKKIVAYHESGHALVGWLLKHTDALLRISIVPRTSSALGFAQYIPSDQKLYSKEELFEKMCMALGGRAAEALIFNHITTGASNDLKNVTEMAYNQIRSYGMNDRIGCLSFSHGPGGQSEELGAKPYSKSLSAVIDQEARLLISQAYQHTEKVLSNNKEKLQQLATKLLEQETLTYDEIKDMIGPPPHGEKNKIEVVGFSDDNSSNNTDTSNNSEKSPRQRRRRNREELRDE